jgi:hypothetical protein
MTREVTNESVDPGTMTHHALPIVAVDRAVVGPDGNRLAFLTVAAA